MECSTGPAQANPLLMVVALGAGLSNWFLGDVTCHWQKGQQSHLCFIACLLGATAIEPDPLTDAERECRARGTGWQPESCRESLPTEGCSKSVMGGTSEWARPSGSTFLRPVCGVVCLEWYLGVFINTMINTALYLGSTWMGQPLLPRGQLSCFPCCRDEAELWQRQ